MRSTKPLLALLVALASAAGLSGCKRDAPPPVQGAAPPPEPATKPGGCAGGGGQVGDPVTAPFLPRGAAGYCVDPNGETRVFGEGGKYAMDAVCTDCFDGECEVYKSFGLKRVVHLRYVDGAGSPGSVEIYLSQFASTEGAYAMFTKRVVADSDPVETAPRKLEAGGGGAIGTGRAYVWKGAYLAELQYANEVETQAQMKASGDKVLPELAKELGAKLPGAATLPAAAARLPGDDLVPMGVSYVLRDALGVAGTGAGALGYYKKGTKRFRVLSIVKEDADQAKDVTKSFSRQKGATEEKGLGDAAVRVVLGDKDGPRTEWIVARAGKLVVGVGDEEFAMKPEMSASERESVALARDEKVARLRALLK